jgi:hypothetical protein
LFFMACAVHLHVSHGICCSHLLFLPLPTTLSSYVIRSFRSCNNLTLSYAVMQFRSFSLFQFSHIIWWIDLFFVYFLFPRVFLYAISFFILSALELVHCVRVRRWFRPTVRIDGADFCRSWKSCWLCAAFDRCRGRHGYRE